MTRDTRLTAHRAVSAALARSGEEELRELVDAATPLGSGIGGTSVLLDIDGTPVFVKQVRLTDLERRPEHAYSSGAWLAKARSWSTAACSSVHGMDPARA